MPNYEVKVTATWWIDIEAESEEEAKDLALRADWNSDGAYEGVDEIKVYLSDEQDEEN